MDKRIRDATRLLCRYGYTYTGRNRLGHLEFKHPDGKLISVSSSPSDRNYLRQIERQARRQRNGGHQ